MIRYIEVVEVDLTKEDRPHKHKVIKQRFNTRLNMWVKYGDLKHTEVNRNKCS